MIIGDMISWLAIALCIVAAITPDRTKRWLHLLGPPVAIRTVAIVALVLFVVLPFVPLGI